MNHHAEMISIAAGQLRSLASQAPGGTVELNTRTIELIASWLDGEARHRENIDIGQPLPGSRYEMSVAVAIAIVIATEVNTPYRTATLIVGRSSSRCGECGKGTLPADIRHIDISGWNPVEGGGCGSLFSAITTDDLSTTADDLYFIRPDLPFLPFHAQDDE